MKISIYDLVYSRTRLFKCDVKNILNTKYISLPPCMPCLPRCGLDLHTVSDVCFFFFFFYSIFGIKHVLSGGHGCPANTFKAPPRKNPQSIQQYIKQVPEVLGVLCRPACHAFLAVASTSILY